MTLDSKESMLRRWSRRKQEAAQATPAADEAAPIDTEDSLGTKAPVEAEEIPVLTDTDMPAIESLDEDSDYSGFMSEGVSDELRNLALRKLFKAPVFNIRDGLDEYDEDYTYFEKLGDIVTCDMKHEIEMKELKEREALEAAKEAETEMEVMESIEDEADDDQVGIEQAEDEDMPDEQAETVAAVDFEPEIKQESKNE